MLILSINVLNNRLISPTAFSSAGLPSITPSPLDAVLAKLFRLPIVVLINSSSWLSLSSSAESLLSDPFGPALFKIENA